MKIVTKMCVSLMLGIAAVLGVSANSAPLDSTSELLAYASDRNAYGLRLPYGYDDWGLPSGVSYRVYEEPRTGYCVSFRNSSGRKVAISFWYYDRRREKWIDGGGSTIKPGEKKSFSAGDYGIVDPECMCYKLL